MRCREKDARETKHEMLPSCVLEEGGGKEALTSAGGKWVTSTFSTSSLVHTLWCVGFSHTFSFGSSLGTFNACRFGLSLK